MVLRKIDTEESEPKTTLKKRSIKAKGKGSGEVFKKPVIAFAVYKNDDNDIFFEPIPIYGNNFGDCDSCGELVTVIPAQPGTYAVYAIFHAIPDEEALLGYDFPGVSSPNWEDVLNQTSYSIEDIQFSDGEIEEIVMFGFPDIEATKQGK